MWAEYGPNQKEPLEQNLHLAAPADSAAEPGSYKSQCGLNTGPTRTTGRLTVGVIMSIRGRFTVTFIHLADAVISKVTYILSTIDYFRASLPYRDLRVECLSQGHHSGRPDSNPQFQAPGMRASFPNSCGDICEEHKG